MNVVSATNAHPAQLVVYVAAGCIDPICAPAWTVPLGAADNLVGSPTVGGDVVYLSVSSPQSNVVAAAAQGCAAATCAEVKRYTFSYLDQPAGFSLSGGRLFANGQSAHLVALGP